MAKDGVSCFVVACLVFAADILFAAETIVIRGERESGQINLESGSTLVVEAGARLLGSTNCEDYAETVMPNPAAGAGRMLAALVFAQGATNITIRGRGIIDGRGGSFPRVNYRERPRLIHLFRCKDVVIEDVTLTNSPRWTCFLQECENVTVRRVKFDGHVNFNNDALDIEAKNVLVEDCDIDTDDDGICIKSHNPDFIVENVRVRNCRIASNCNFIKLGTRGAGGFRHIEISDCVLKPCRVDGIRNWSRWQPKIAGVTDPITGLAGICLEEVDGGVLEDVHVHDIDMGFGGVQTPVFIRLARRAEHPSGRKAALRNILVENVRGVSASSIASSITGVPGLRPQGVTIRNVDLALKGGGRRADALCAVPEAEDGYPENRCFDHHMLPGYGFYVRHADRVRFENVRLRLQEGESDEREPVVSDDSTAVEFERCDFAAPARPRAGSEKPVYILGERPVVWLKRQGPYSLCEWRGRRLADGVSDGEGRVTFENIGTGYYTVRSDGMECDFAVVIDPSKRREDRDGFLGADSALSWIAKPQFFAEPPYGGDTCRYVADLMRLAGIRRTRERLSWGEVQPKGELPPEFGLYWYNQRRLAERGISVCGMFQSAPTWMRKIERLPADFAGLFSFAKTLAEELPAMEAWEFWNEEIEGFAPEAAWDFAAANKAAALGFRAGREDVKVLNGSLCFRPNDYDRLLFRNGLGKYLDAVNIHAYPALSDYPEIFGERREFAVDVGEGDQAIWVTECGTMAMGEPELSGRNRKERRFSRDQELLLAEFYPKSQCYQMMEGMSRNYFFVFGAFSEDGGKKDFSVIRRNGSVAPVFAAIATMTEKLADMKLEGELDVGEGIRAFLFSDRGGSGRQTLAFASVSGFDVAKFRMHHVSKVDDYCLRNFTVTAEDGEYPLSDMCGMARTAVASGGILRLKSSRFMRYVEGLRGLTASKVPKRANSSQRYRPRPDEDLSVVIRPAFEKGDYELGGIKSLARLLKRSAPISFEVWNLSPRAKRGRLEPVRGGSISGLPAEVVVQPMAGMRVTGVYTPDSEKTELEVRGVFEGRATSPVVVPIESLGDFFATCRIRELDGANPSRWRRNDSADEYECVREGDAVVFTAVWKKDADRWFYPRYVFGEDEDPSGAEFLEFEARSEMTDGRNAYTCQNYWLDARDGRSERHDLSPTGTDWRRYRIPLAGTVDPRTGKVGLSASDLMGFRVGGNPGEWRLRFCIRNLRLLKRGIK